MLASHNVQMPERFGERLRRARAMRGWSQRDLANALERDGRVSAAALSKYEKGRMLPSSGVLIALSRALDVRPDYFFERQEVRLEGVEFRKKARFGKKKQTQIKEQAREFLERRLEVQRLLGIENPAFPRLRLKGQALGEEIEAAAERLREDWDLGQDPLANVQEMLEDRGVAVLEVDVAGDCDGLSGWSDSNPVVILSRRLKEDLPRKRFTLLHELAHLALEMPEGLDEQSAERLCHRFAGAMLLPKHSMLEAFGSARRSYGHISGKELEALKEQWGISIAAVMMRAQDLGLVGPAHVRRFFRRARASGWHREEPGVWIGREESSRLAQLVHRAAAQELISHSKAAGLLGIRLQEFDRQYGSVE